jgi:NADPH:quinone reductase-like Zn-dependent oxidoreductase
LGHQRRDFVDQKRIKVIVSATFPLAEAAKAEAKADTGRSRQKGDEPK